MNKLTRFLLALVMVIGLTIGLASTTQAAASYCGPYNICKNTNYDGQTTLRCDTRYHEMYREQYTDSYWFYWNGSGWTQDHMHHIVTGRYYPGIYC